MTTAVKPKQRKHPPEFLDLWYRKGDWLHVPDIRWAEVREDAKRFNEAGWAKTARQLGWTTHDLLGLKITISPDGKKMLDYLGLVGRLGGGFILMMDSKSAIYRKHLSRGTTRFIRRPIGDLEKPAQRFSQA